MPDTTETTAKPAGGNPAETPQDAGQKPPADSAAAPKEPTTAKEKLSYLAKMERQRLDDLNRWKNETASERTARERAEARLKELEEALSLAEKDPLAYLQKKGITARQLAETVVKEGTPEAALEAANRRIEALEREGREREAQTAAERNYQLARQQLRAAWNENKANLPALAQVVEDDEEALVEEYLLVYEKVQKHPELRQHTYTDAEILAAANERISKRYLRNGSTRATVVPDASSGQSASTAGSSARTLTNGASAEKASSWKPDNWDKLPDAVQNRLLAEALEKGTLK